MGHHEIEHDGHRLLAITDGRGSLSLRSRNGFNRTHLFQAPFSKLANAGRQLVLDGEILPTPPSASCEDRPECPLTELDADQRRPEAPGA